MPSFYGTIPTSDSPHIASPNADSIYLGAPPPPTLKSSVRFIFLSNWINVLLPFVPLGIVATLFDWPYTWVFWTNFFALVPLAKLLGVATEELALRTNETIGGLLNATFGNAVEMIVGLIALKEGLITVVQASLLGSILSNLLLVLGASFLAGGLYFKNQSFNVTGAQTSASLLSISVLAFVVPAAFQFTVMDDEGQRLLLELSRGTAVVLLTIYILFLLFQLRTHADLFTSSASTDTTDVLPTTPTSPAPSVLPPAPHSESETPNLTLPVSVALLLISTLLVSILGDNLISALEPFTAHYDLSPTFVGLILLPIVGNAAEHVTAVSVATKDKMDLVIGVAIGSSMQIALLVTPVLVLVGWAWGQPLSLAFSAFETSVMFVSVFVVNSVIQDGQTNWLEGAMLLGAYLVVAWAFFVLP
ncbi:hypothetical protein BC832DRAFT_545381 [Gaertneriomyces semiglobifer]|nr:hypothetical protein BC832DRAFT_545381 [Gaertneriomyces semiglobifer]